MRRNGCVSNILKGPKKNTGYYGLEVSTLKSQHLLVLVSVPQEVTPSQG